MEFPGYHIVPEPQLSFDAMTPKASHIHPLQGLKDFGPHSCNLMPVEEIRVAAIYPRGTRHILEGLFKEFTQSHNPKERKRYLPDYTGFETIFKSKISLTSSNICVELEGVEFSENKSPYITLTEEISNALRTMSQRKQDFDVLAIYLPESWAPAFVDVDSGFDLHDYIKGTTAMMSIPTQILREDSVISYKCRCSVMWRLSIAFYVKGGGVPWRLSSIDQETAFIGLSYSSRLNKNTGQFDFITCCSQVFDADGTGMEFIAYDASEIESRIGDNPFLTRVEMRKVIAKSLQLYQRRHAGRQPKRLIVHKTSHFKSQEIDGAFDAINTNMQLELLQIVQDQPWAATQHVNYGKGWSVPGYPVSRGVYAQIDQQEVLLWTQGQVKLGEKNNFYKEGKGIPSPLLIRRFAGKGGWDKNCQAILGLTKMNWNHDGIYDRLPVTLGYASVLAKTIKKMNDLTNKPYEFRYFM
ncbi:hypothetical protein LCL86_01650 [Muricauda ruestringensis]|uniref:argonaute/piwi family protein n=1 Tax=Flagellimonas ruestringensis TaxID=111501 RepID=UPI001CD586AB|nr:hypothetical protein [Allomuricauda ruestringensis]MCA0957730.1 hypothetical protein [Allomuricauda ruestringensis]